MSELILCNAQNVRAAMPDRFWALPPEDFGLLIPGVWAKLRVAELDESGSGNLWASHPIWVEVTESRSGLIEGMVTGLSSIDRAGYREGDRVTFTPDRVFDVCAFDPRGRPVAHLGKVAFMTGKTVIIGITVLSAENTVVEQRQLLGRIQSVGTDAVVVTLASREEAYRLPPDVRAFTEAPPGQYRFRTTGEVVTDPDFECRWTLRQPAAEGKSQAFYSLS